MSDKIISEANMNKSGVYPGWKAKAAADAAAQAAKTEVTVTQVQESTNGTKIATIGVDDVNTDIYAPAVSATQVQGSTNGTKIATIDIGANSTDIYAPAVAVTPVQGSSGATKIATIDVGATSTDIYAPAGGGGGGVFVANFVQDFNLNTLTCDKTNAEILTAISNGIPVLATYSTATEPHEKQYCCGNYSVENAKATFQFMKIYYDTLGTPKATDSLYLIEITWIADQSIWMAFGNGYSLTPVSNP